MIDYHKELKTALSSILPTHYEMNLTSKTATPCISYMELNNSVDVQGDTIGYSKANYQVKIWSNDMAVIQRYSIELDKVLRALGFTRISSGELYDNNSSMIQKIFNYEVLFKEEF